MKSSHLAAGAAAAGFLLGTRAGRERWEAVVRAARRVTGSQTVQATAGVVQAQVEGRVQRAREAARARFGDATVPQANRTAAKPGPTPDRADRR
ncbi:hypothetical protein [Jatrophihabitans fulvus]